MMSGVWAILGQLTGVLGIAALVAGVIILATPDERRIRAWRRRIARARSGRAPGEDVVLEGEVAEVAEVSPALESPLSGKRAAWFQLVAREDHGAQEEEWRTALDRSAGDAIAIQTGAGLVVASRSQVDGALSITTSSQRVVDGPDRLERWLEHNGLSRLGDDGFKRQRRYEERRIEIGQKVGVVGRIVRAGACEAAGPYREAASSARLELVDGFVHAGTAAQYLAATSASSMIVAALALAGGAGFLLLAVRIFQLI